MNRPIITVVVPAYNEERSIGACLDSLTAQTLNGPLEIIVVDNGSSDRTVEIATAKGVRVLREARKGVCFARQAGTRAASAALVANLDADSVAAPDWLERLLPPFSLDERVVAVAGPVVYRDAPGWARAHANGFTKVNTFSMRLTGGTAFVMASNLAFRKAAFDRVGGYDLTLPTIGDEADFLFNLRRVGRVAFEPTARVSTSARRFQRGPLHFAVVEVGYQTVFAYVLGKRFHRPVRRQRADIREAAPPARGRGAPRSRNRRGRYWSWVGLPLGLLAAAFFMATRPRSQIYGPTLARAKTRRRVVSLTFDDGPCEPFTSQVLDILARWRAPATFFMVGQNVERCPEVARRVVREGHTIGNHTQQHHWRDALFAWCYPDLERAQATIERATGVRPRYFRPPLGIHTPWQLREVRRAGLTPVQWSIEANDPHRPGVEAIARRVLESLHPGGIILLHDGEGTRARADRTQTVAALPRILAGARAAGYRFVALDRLCDREP